MIRVLPFVAEFALLVFCLIDCVQTDSLRVRNLRKSTWIVLILVLPLVGGIAWLVAGRPGRTDRRTGVWYSERTGFPEDERPHDLAPRALSGQVDRRVADEQARVDAEFEAAVRRARAAGGARKPPEGGATPEG